MGILKFGVIGVIIMLPFLFMTYAKEKSIYQHDLLMDYVDEAISEATYDAAFAMKTYSEASYDGESIYRIDIPYDTVIATFFDSLTYRDFPYVLSDFVFLIFVEYDGIVLYQPSTQQYFPKYYYCEETDTEWRYSNLSLETLVINKESGEIKHIPLSKETSGMLVLDSLEKILNIGLRSMYSDKTQVFELPTYDDSFMTLALNDVSFAAIYKRQSNDFLGSMEVMSIKPSGLMKKTFY